ncbi:DsbA family oxidoreductase [Roseibium sp. SCP14]|uniref:DsbA family oxidoreductase n=1 Tax=Roseibium sp. SCP14 TaxID=3141375 RepID=UPI00333DC3AC
MKEIVVYTDYVCPYCLLAEPMLRTAIEGRGIKITWRGFELRPHPVPTLRVEDEYLPSVWRSSVYPMAERLGIDIQLPTISPQPRTDKAFEALLYAEQHDLGDAFSVAVLSAFFQKNLDIGDISILVKIGEQVGLNGASLKDALVQNRFRHQHQDFQRTAHGVHKIKVVPTIMIGDQRYEGVPNADWLYNAIGRLEAR